MSSRAKVISATVVVALLAAAGAAFAAVKLSSTSRDATVPVVTSPFRNGLGSYGLGGGRLGGRGFGGGLGSAGGGFGFGFRRVVDGGMTAAASYLGLSASQLQSDLQNGQTLTQIAKSQGKTVDGLIAAMAAQLKKALDKAVSQGVLTQAQADQIASGLEARMKDMVNGVRSRFGSGPGGGGFAPRGGFGPGGGLGGGPNGSGTGSIGSSSSA